MIIRPRSNIFVVLLLIIIISSLVVFVIDIDVEQVYEDEVSETKSEVSEMIRDINEIINSVDISYTPQGVNFDDEVDDYIEDSDTVVNYWNYYDVNLTQGVVIRMVSYDESEFKLDGKVSTEYEYGIITIRKDDGSLVKEKLSYEWFLSIKPNDIIQ